MSTIFILAALTIPLALPLGLEVGRWVGGLLGHPSVGPSFRAYRVGAAIGGVTLLLFFALEARHAAREAALVAERRIGELENRRLEAELAALRAEMKPHLLFNALNTVAALVHESPERAEGVLLQLSELYRGVLRSSAEATHSLDEEVQLARAYLAIEEARFGERLASSIEIAPELAGARVAVPVLLLQPFVENAVKHGISPRREGGRVSLTAARDGDSLRVIVEDDGVGLGRSTQKGAGRALLNCNQRLELAYGRRAQISVAPRELGGTRVTITMPAEER